jgi:hypothetical protein
MLCILHLAFAATDFCHFFPILELSYVRCVLRLEQSGGDAMDEGAELATAGLVVAFAAVLLVVSHFFLEAQSAKRFIDSSMNLRARTNIVATGL